MKRKEYRKKETRTAWLFLAPSLVGITVLILLPFADAVRRSFYDAMGRKFVSLNNYQTVIHNKAFLLAAGNTGRFLLTCIPLLIVFSLLLSLLSYGRRSGSFFKTIFLVPMAIPVACVALLWQVFFHENGLINHGLLMMHRNPVDFMGTSRAFYVLVFSYLWKNTGYDMVLWNSGLSSISSALYEAASLDGAGTWKKFRYITMPGLLPTLSVTVILSFVNSFKVFREAYLIAGGYPQDSIYMLQHLFNNWFIALDLQKMCAAAVMIAACFVIFVLLIRRLDSKEVEE